MSLREYQRKRNFRRTPEPQPTLATRRGSSYVIQKACCESWDELTPDIHSDTFAVQNLSARLQSLRKDSCAAIGKTKQSLSASIKRKLAIR